MQSSGVAYLPTLRKLILLEEMNQGLVFANLRPDGSSLRIRPTTTTSRSPGQLAVSRVLAAGGRMIFVSVISYFGVKWRLCHLDLPHWREQVGKHFEKHFEVLYHGGWY